MFRVVDDLLDHRTDVVGLAAVGRNEVGQRVTGPVGRVRHRGGGRQFTVVGRQEGQQVAHLGEAGLLVVVDEVGDPGDLAVDVRPATRNTSQGCPMALFTRNRRDAPGRHGWKSWRGRDSSPPRWSSPFTPPSRGSSPTPESGADSRPSSRRLDGSVSRSSSCSAASCSRGRPARTTPARRFWQRRPAKIRPNHSVTAVIALTAAAGVSGALALPGAVPNLLLVHAWYSRTEIFPGVTRDRLRASVTRRRRAPSRGFPRAPPPRRARPRACRATAAWRSG